MMTLADEMRKCKGRNQARQVLKAHCERLGIDYRDYVLTPDERQVYFAKLPYSPYSRKPFDPNAPRHGGDVWTP